MTGLFVMLGGITLFALILTVMDGIAYRRRLRKEGKSGSSPAGAAGCDE